MKTSTQSLLAALNKAKSTCAGRTTLPILNCVRLEGKDGKLSIQSTDGQQWSEIFVECEGDLSALCVNPVLLLNSVCECETVSMELKASKLHVESSASAQISVLPANEFPPFPENKFRGVGLNLADLATGIKAVAWSAAVPNGGREEAEVVHVLATPKKLRTTATDGHTLAQWSMAAICAELELVIPVQYAKRLVEELVFEKAKLSVSETSILVKHKEGRYIIPKAAKPFYGEAQLGSIVFKGTKLGKFHRGFFENFSSRCIQLYTSDATLFPAVKLEFDKMGLKAYMDSGLTSFEQKLKGQFPDHRVKLGAAYLKSACHAFDEEEVLVEFKDALSPIKFSAGNLTVYVLGMVWN